MKTLIPSFFVIMVMTLTVGVLLTLLTGFGILNAETFNTPIIVLISTGTLAMIACIGSLIHLQSKTS